MTHRMISPLIVMLAILFVAGCTKNENVDDKESAEQTQEQAAIGEGSDEANEEAETEEGRVERWVIAAGTVDCEGVAPQKCMRVKRGGNSEWTLLYSGIDGMDAAPDEEIEADIRITEVENPPADGSSERYELVEVVSPKTGNAGTNGDSSGGNDKAEKDDADKAASGEPCTQSSDCADNEMCAGPEGCDVEWTCQERRPCTRDLRAYCNCDGETVRGSGSCPPEPYEYRGECRTDR